MEGAGLLAFSVALGMVLQSPRCRDERGMEVPIINQQRRAGSGKDWLQRRWVSVNEGSVPPCSP